MTEFIYFQSLVQYRIPINPDGTAGTPEVLKKFTSPIMGTVSKKRVIKKKELQVDEVGEIAL